MVDRTKAPGFKKVESINIQNPENYILENGVPFYVINAGAQPVLRLEIIIKAGSWYEIKPGLAYFTSKMLIEGTLSKSANEIAYFFDKYGAHIEISPGFDFIIINLYTLSKHLSVLLPVLQEIITEPAFPGSELEIIKKIKIQNTQVNNEKTNYLASVNFRKKIFGEDHPYGKELTEKEINGVSSDDLKDFYQHYLFNNWEIILAGQVEPEHIKLVRQSFGLLQRTSIEKTKPLSSENGQERFIIEKSSSLQSSIRLGKKLLPKNHPDFHKMQVVNEILGGYFGSRLMKNIREDKGFTYGIHSNLNSFKFDGYLVIGTDVRKENTIQTIDEIYKEIRLLAEKPVENYELESVKNYMTGSFLAEINTPFALADKFKAVYLSGLNYNYYQELLTTIHTITPEEIMETAQQYLQPDSMTEVIAGGI